MFENQAFYIEMVDKKTAEKAPVDRVATSSIFKEYLTRAAITIGCLILLSASAHAASEIAINKSK